VDLDAKRRKRLRGLAHALEPVVHVGKGLLTDELAAQVERALEAHELIKIRFVAGKEEKRELAAELARRTGAVAAGVVGNVAILYRAHPEASRRKVRLD